MSTNKGNEHKGHRQRLKDKFIENGLDIFEPHEALELFLFYAIPQKDTNPLAHRLLDKYLTIGGVCDAPIDELMKESGISKSAATLLKLLPEMSRLYNESKLNLNNVLELENVGDMFLTKFIGRTEECVALLLADAKGKIIYFNIISHGSISSTDVPVRKIVDLSLRLNAKSALIAHNHPSGNALPSKSDIETTRLISVTLQNVGVSLIDHYIIADNDYISLRDSGIMGSIFCC